MQALSLCSVLPIVPGWNQSLHSWNTAIPTLPLGLLCSPWVQPHLPTQSSSQSEAAYICICCGKSLFSNKLGPPCPEHPNAWVEKEGISLSGAAQERHGGRPGPGYRGNSEGRVRGHSALGETRWRWCMALPAMEEAPMSAPGPKRDLFSSLGPCMEGRSWSLNISMSQL